MAGVLQFTLGLETSKFLSQIGISSAATLSFTTVARGLGAVFDRVGEQISRGAALNDLSKRTGASVASLFQLQSAFKAVGLDSASVGGSLFSLTKALGGVNDAGEDTKSIFAKAGLNVKELEAKGPVAAMQDILAAIAKMNTTSGAAFAGKIFRGSSADIVQAARSLEEFNAALGQSRAQGQAFERVAGVFSTLNNAFSRIKEKLDPLFLMMAEKVAPVLQSILDQLNNLDLQPMADAIGKYLDALKASFGTSDFAELIRLSISAGFEQAKFYAAQFAATFGAALAAAIPPAIEAGVKASESVLLTIGERMHRATIEKAIELDKRSLDRMEKRQGAYRFVHPADLETYKADTRARIQKNEEALGDLTAGSRQARRQYILDAADNMQKAIQDAISAASETFKSFGTAPTEALGKLQAKVAEILAKAAPSLEAAGAAVPGQNLNFGSESSGRKAPKPEVSDLEKQGLIFNRGLYRGPAETTARNTTQLVQLTRNMLGSIGRLLLPESNAPAT